MKKLLTMCLILLMFPMMSFTYKENVNNVDYKILYLDNESYQNTHPNDNEAVFYVNQDLIDYHYSSFKFVLIYKTINEELNSVIKYNFSLGNNTYNSEIFAPKTITKNSIENKINDVMSNINNNTYNISRINNDSFDDKITIVTDLEPVVIKRYDYLLMSDGLYYGEVIEYNTLYKTYVDDLDTNYYFMSTEQIVKPTNSDNRIKFDGLVLNNIVNENISEIDLRHYFMYDLKDSNKYDFTINLDRVGFSDDKFSVNIHRNDINYEYKLINTSSSADNSVGCYYDYLNAHHNKGDYYNYSKSETYHFMGSIYKARLKEHKYNLNMSRKLEMFNDHFLYNLGVIFNVNVNFNV